MKLLRALIGFSLFVIASVAHAGFDEGMVAYEKGDFKTAFSEWQPLAEQGRADAQNNLGLMYAQGKGVQQNYKNAIKWYRLAVEQGYADAQSHLGGMYNNGRGVPENRIVAYALFILAATNAPSNDDSFAKFRDSIATNNTQKETESGQRLSNEMALHPLKALDAYMDAADEALPAITPSVMTVSIEPPDAYGVMSGDRRWKIFVVGSIDRKSPALIQAALEKAGGNGAKVYFNSPGGNLLSGIEIGRIIRRHEATTNIGQRKIGVNMVQPADCYSACSLAFLGGVYRFSGESSVYGVHRFSSSVGASDSDLDTAQILSAAVSSYIREMGVDPHLFDLMVSAGKDEIYVVSPVEMMRLGVVNNGRQRAEWTIEAVEGAQYLKGAQNSEYGIAKALFTCVNGGLMFHSIYEAGAEKSKRIANGGWYHSLMVNGKTQPVTLTKIKVVNGLLNTLFPISRRDAVAISQADSVGHAMQIAPDAPTFVGYRIDIDSRYRERITNFLGACVPAVK